MKLFIYDNAKPHVHDEVDIYKNTVPLSNQGIKEHCQVTSPDVADYFYMGQLQNNKFNVIKRNQFKYFEGNEDRHICDVEGEGGMPIPEWLHKSIITTMGPLKQYENVDKLFARPTFSYLLLDIIKNRNEKFEVPNEKSFGFRGYMNHKIRAMMVYTLHKSSFKKELHVNRRWAGPSEIGGKVQGDYIETMKNNLISLCPRGSGIDSVRLIESCYYTRVPVLISDHDYFLVGEDEYDLDFVYRITGKDLTPEELDEKLNMIYDTPISELKDRAFAAREYFDTVIRSYFEDPTEYFQNWLQTQD